MAYNIPMKKKKDIDDRYPILNEEDYKKIADKKGLSENDKKVYVKFMQKRFAGERHTPYAEEWAERFKKGEPESHMDSESLEVYKIVKEKPHFISEPYGLTQELQEKDKFREEKKPKRVPKTKEVFVVQGNYGQGWEDVTEEDNYFEAKKRLKEYNENESYPHRRITRRVKI